MDKIKVRINRNSDGSVEFEFDKEGFNSEDAKSAIETYLNSVYFLFSACGRTRRKCTKSNTITSTLNS